MSPTKQVCIRWKNKSYYRIGTLRHNWPVRHRPSARRLYRFGRFTANIFANPNPSYSHVVRKWSSPDSRRRGMTLAGLHIHLCLSLYVRVRAAASQLVTRSTRHTVNSSQVNSSPGRLVMQSTRHRGGPLVTSKQTSKHQSRTAAAV